MPVVTKVPGSGIATSVQLAEVESPLCVNAMVAWACVAVRPTNAGPGVYVPVRSTNNPVAVSASTEPPVAINSPKSGFEMEKPPPVGTVVSVTLNGPNSVNNGITVKSPVPSPVVFELTPENVLPVVRFSPPVSVTETPAKAMDPMIALASNIVVQAVITAKRNKGRVEARRFMVLHLLRNKWLCASCPKTMLQLAS